MTIPDVGQRFQSLRQSFSLPISSISKADPTAIINSGSNSLNLFSDDVLKAARLIARQLNIGSLVNDAANLKNTLERQLGLKRALGQGVSGFDAIRQIRGLFKSTFDPSKFSSSAFDRYINTFLGGDPLTQGLIRNLDKNNGNALSTNITTGKPYAPVVNLPNGATPPAGTAKPLAIGDANYNYSDILTAIEKISKTSTGQTAVDKNQILLQLITLGNMAYDANMSGVVAALKNIPNVTLDILARAIAIILAEQASKGNAAAVLDIANNTTAVLGDGANPIHDVPCLVSDLFEQFKLPIGGKEWKYDDMVDQLLLSAGLLDPSWDISDEDNIISIKYVKAISSDLQTALQCRATDNVFDDTGLDTPFATDDDVLLAAMLGVDPQLDGTLRSMEVATA